MSDTVSLAYLAAAIVASLLTIVLALRLSRPLAELMAPGFGASSVTPSQQLLLARLVLLGLALVAAQAILRWPLAQVLARDGSALQADAGVAAAALAGVLALLVWVYQTARPMVQAVTLRAIDGAIPTTGAAPVAEPTRTSPSMAREPIPSSTDAVTVVAPLFAPSLTDEATVATGRDAPPLTDEATVATGRDAPPLTDEATVAVGRDADATLRAGRDADATLRAGTDPEATLRVRDS